MRQVWEMKNALSLMVDRDFPEKTKCKFCIEPATRLIRFVWNDCFITDYYCCQEHYLLLEPYFYTLKEELAKTIWTSFEQGKPSWFDERIEKIIGEYLAKAVLVNKES